MPPETNASALPDRPDSNEEGPRLTLRDRLADWLMRRLARPAVQAGLMHLPLGRSVARGQARKLYDICAGFVYSQILAAIVELELCAFLANGPRSVPVIARYISCDVEQTDILLSAARALGVVRRTSSGAYGLGLHGAALLADPGIAAMVRHHRLLYSDLADPVALFRAGAGAEMARFWAYATAADSEAAQLPAAVAAEYSAVMAASQAMVSAQILSAYSFARHRMLMDVGGGEGMFVEAVGGAAPDLHLALMDLPPVAARARDRLAGTAVGRRLTCYGGNFLTESLPDTGADLITLVRVLHDQSDAGAAALLARVRAALPAGGRVLIAETMAETAGADPVGDAYFGTFLLAMGRGRARSADTIRAMLRAAGFPHIEERATALPLIVRVLVAS